MDNKKAGISNLNVQINLETETILGKALTFSHAIKVVDVITVNELQYKMSSLSTFSEVLDKSLTFPQTEKKFEDLMEGKFLHIAIQASSASGEVIDQIYISLIKTKDANSLRNLPQNKYAVYDSKKKQYEITIDPKYDLAHLNGEYEFEIHFADKLSQKV